jgi:hypothetical protein
LIDLSEQVIDDLAIVDAEDDEEEGEDEETKNEEGGRKGYKSLKQIEDNLIDITEENIKEYSLEDVVMPVIGFKTRLPNNKDL